MKLLIGSSAQPDHGAGVHSYVKELCRYLTSRGHQLTVLSRPPRTAGWAMSEGVRSVVYEFDSDPLQAAGQVSALLVDGEFDGVINNDHPVLQSLAPVSPCPFISIGHLGRTSMGALACHNHVWIDHVVAISSDMKQAFIGRYGVAADRIEVVYNGVADVPRVASAPTPRPTLQLIFGGGYLRYKGADKLASAALSGDWNGAQLHWYGAVPARVGRKLGQLPHVVLHGHAPRDVFMEALAGSDCLVLPSREEGCPMVMLEAMSLGIAPIVSDGVGAMKEIVVSEVNGLVCPLRDWNRSLHRRVRQLVGDPGFLARIKEGARRTYLEKLTMERTAERLLALLRQPRVDRSSRPAKVRILDWHRPISGAPLWHIARRIRTRLGLLRHAGSIAISGAMTNDGATVGHAG